MFQLQRIIIFREYQYLQTCTAFLHRLSIVDVDIYSAIMLFNVIVMCYIEITFNYYKLIWHLLKLLNSNILQREISGSSTV